jgi:predicted Zn-dependent protease
MHSNAHPAPTQGRLPAWRRLTALLLCAPLISASLPAMAASDRLPNLGDNASDELSPVQERKLGEEIMRQARAEDAIFGDPESTEYLNRFGEVLIRHAPPNAQSFEFFLVQDSDINAFALPGGFIGVNTGLIEATQTEGELASVMSHEMGHVIQHHIARGMDHDKRTALMTFAAVIVGILAGLKSKNASTPLAVIAGAETYMVSSQAAFSRDAEREADRVGFKILRDSGFDPASMTSFFGQIEHVIGPYENGLPDWARDHPMTTERIADIQNRFGIDRTPQRPDSAEFQMIRARLRVLQDETVQGLSDSKSAFMGQLHSKAYPSEAAIHYGLSLVLLRQHDSKEAAKQIDLAEKALKEPCELIASQRIAIALADDNAQDAVKLAKAAHAAFPQSRALIAHYAEALQAAGQFDEGIAFLHDQLALYASEALLYELLAKDYALKGEPMLEHKAMAENYYLRGSLSAAVEQLQIARRNGNGDFYELSQIDARMRDLQAQLTQDKEDRKENGGRSSFSFTASSQFGSISSDPDSETDRIQNGLRLSGYR